MERGGRKQGSAGDHLDRLARLQRSGGNVRDGGHSYLGDGRPGGKEFCQAQRPIEPALRLEQLLGLPPDDGKQWFVELWVWPADLFRPAPDPEITDQGAGLDFPDSASPEYRAWFDDLRSKSYGENGYPWTRLGYTYDWGSPDDHVGLSEFVINKGAPIEVRSVTPTVVYCG